MAKYQYLFHLDSVTAKVAGSSPDGVFRFEDEPRFDCLGFLRHIGAKHGIERIVFVSGDRPQEVNAFG